MGYLRAPTGGEMAAVARRGAAIILKRGKATGWYEDWMDRVDAIGALQEAAQELRLGDDCLPYLPLAVAQQCERLDALRPTRDLLTWSDLPATTEADIAVVFLQVADEIGGTHA